MSAQLSSILLLRAFQDSYQDLVRFIARRTGSTHDARELAHDTWLRLAERAESPQHGGETPPEPAARAYVYEVAENIAIDHLRRRRRGMERFATASHIDADDCAAREPGTHDVADLCAHRQALDAVDAALRKLPQRSRDIFLADRLEGIGHAALAERYGVSIKTVEREVMRALDSIEAALHRWRGDAVPVRTGRRRALSTLLGIAGLGIGSAVLWQAWRQWVPDYQGSLSTAIGRIRSQALPDGSRLTLDADSRAEVTYYAARRTVRLLAGSVFFDVARDESRPFVVTALGHEITVLGTRFEAALQDGSLCVAVQSGRVRVRSSGGEERILGAGDSARIDASRRFTTAHPGEAAAVASWREGWLDFHHVPLGEVVSRLARYSPRPLRVEPDAASLPVFGRVQIAQAGTWLRLLPGSLPVQVREETGSPQAIVIARRSQP
ncbi:sigma-70 family RNA polymerase sigma factor [Variovorax guangxiensis]|uniref:RNA polymerase sigma factor (Sigma-70 family) n=1 Tax=Variovorax guangxiensis TaxID=1775474 RepID=A0A840FVZ1_9BURK|nr:sigma-70 family RNA polymerase sigma factor [Variovorax guangxiensis]MBB4221381.1 RNA polymerase sigma factor (sigma-70 family) [Variovorax guangxiensis]